MTRIPSTLIALVIGATATAGAYAAVQGVPLGQKAAAPAISARDLALRQAKLAAWGRSLHRTLAKRPPALPKLPHFAPVHTPPPTRPVTYVQAPTIVTYRRAPSATATTSATASDDGSADDGSSDDGGGD